MGPEAEIQSDVINWANENGIYAYKFHELYNSSAPDRLFILPKGIAVFIEFKAPGKKPTKAQYRELKKLHSSGHIAYWFDNADKAITFLKTFL